MSEDTTKCLVMLADTSLTIEELELTEKQVKAKCDKGMTVITFDTDTGNFYFQPGAEQPHTTKFYLFLEKREVVLVTEKEAKEWMECEDAVIVKLNVFTLKLSSWNNSKSHWETIG